MAQRYQVVLAAEAEAGIEQIVNYLEQEASYEIAEKVRLGIMEAIDGLADMPTRHGIV